MEENKSAVMKIEFSNDQVELIKKTIAPEATDDELNLFLYQAKRTGLDPLTRQLYFMKRRNLNKRTGRWESKVSIQTSIDGFRVVAERSGSYAGQDEPEFEEGNPYPKVCKVRVYRFGPGGQRYQASVGVAYWDEYFPGDKEAFMWRKMPHTMLAKVAEALALRKAFPQDLSGIYTQEEMNQSEMSSDAQVDTEKKIPASIKKTPEALVKPKEDEKPKRATRKRVVKDEPIDGEVVEDPIMEATKHHDDSGLSESDKEFIDRSLAGEVQDTVQDTDQEEQLSEKDQKVKDAKLKWIKMLAQSEKLPNKDYDSMTLKQLSQIMDDYRKGIGK